MAIAVTLVGSRGNSAGTSATTGAGTTAASGSTFLVALSYGIASQGNPLSVVDNKGNTFTLISGSRFAGGSSNSAAVEWWITENGVGGAGHTATVTFSGGEATTIRLFEVTGATAPGVDAITGRASVTTDDLIIPVPATGSFAQADELIMAVVGNAVGGGITYSDSTGTFTKLDEEGDGNSWWTSAVFSRIISSTAAITTGFADNVGTGAFQYGSVVSIKQSSGGGAAFDLSGAAVQAAQTAGGTLAITAPVFDLTGATVQPAQTHSGTLGNTQTFTLTGATVQAAQVHAGTLGATVSAFNLTGATVQPAQTHSGTLGNTVPVFDLTGTTVQAVQIAGGALTTGQVFDLTGATVPAAQIHAGTLAATVPAFDLTGATVQAAQIHAGTLTKMPIDTIRIGTKYLVMDTTRAFTVRDITRKWRI